MKISSRKTERPTLMRLPPSREPGWGGWPAPFVAAAIVAASMGIAST